MDGIKQMASNWNFLEKKLYGLFLWMGFNCLLATEPLWGCSLLFTVQFPEVPGAQCYDKTKNYIVIKDPDFESKRKRAKKCLNLKFLFLILLHNNFRQLLSIWNFFTSSMLGILQQTKELIVIQLIKYPNFEFKNWKKNSWKMLESGGVFYILTYDNHDQTNDTQLKFFTQALCWEY